MPSLNNDDRGLPLPNPTVAELEFPKWFLAVILMGTLAVVIGGADYYRAQESQRRNEAEQNLAAIVKLKVEAIDKWRKKLIKSAFLVAQSQAVKTGISTGTLNSSAVIDRLNSCRIYGGFEDVMLVNDKGEVRISSIGKPRALTGEEAAALRAALLLGTGTLSEMFIVPGLNGPRMSVAIPAHGFNGTIEDSAAAIVLVVNPADYLYPEVSAWPVPSLSAETLLVRREGGNVLYLNDLRHQTNTALKMSIPLTRSDLPAAKAIQGWRGLIEGKDYRGVNVLAISAPVPDSSWFLLGKIDRAEALAVWNFSAWMILVTIATILAALALAMVIAWQVRQKGYYRAAFQAQVDLKESETKFRRLFEASREMIVLHELALDPNGKPVDYRILDCNPAFTVITGITREQAVGKLATVLYGTGAPPYLDTYAEVVATGRPMHFETYFSPMNKHFEISIAPLSRDHFATITEDITVRKQAEAMLRESEERYRSLVETAKDVIYTLDPLGNITSLNPVFETITGMPVRDWIGKSFLPLVIKDDLPLAMSKFEDALNQKAVGPFEARILCAGGREVVAEFNIVPQLHEGRVVSILGVGRDITATKKLQQQFLQAQKIETVGRLAGGVAHDFNNILQAIMGYSQLLLDETPPTDARHSDIEEIQRNSERAAALTRQLLAFSRRQMLQRRAVNLADLIGNLAKMLKRLLGENVALKQVQENKLWSVKVDPGQIDQILMNLAVNARDAMPNGGTLTLCAENRHVNPHELEFHPEGRAGDFVCLTVADNGTGMTAEVQANLFEPFFTTKGIGKGTGLGLATVHGIVKQHEGWIEMSSRVGEGTTFRIYFPATHDATAAEPAIQAASSSTGHRERIVVVEDSTDVSRLICEILTRGGYSVVSAGTCAGALALCDSRVSLIFSDILLPDGNGVDLVERLQEQFPALRCVLCSAYSDIHERWPEIVERGWIFLNKPVHKDELLKAVAGALGDG